MPQDPSDQPETASSKSQRPVRRRFSEREKLRILEAADRCTRPGEMGRTVSMTLRHIGS